MLQNATTYDQKKARLVAELKSNQDGTLALKKSNSNLFRPRISTISEKKIDVKSFNKVLSIDPELLVAEIEGMATYEAIVEETLKYGCLPTVVPELKSITIGGALSGCGIESSSFRHGLVHESILEAEVLLSDGSILVCNPHENSDLFWALPNTFGTLGYVLKVKVRLIRAKPYVKITYERFVESALFFQALAEQCENKHLDFLDGVIFDENELYLIRGQFVDEAPYTSDYTYSQIFYRSIQKRKEDYLTTLDYIWRWDPDWFWCSKVFYMQHPLPRLLFGKWMLNSKVYAKIMHFFNRHPALGRMLDKVKGRTESVIQDVLIPASKALSFYEFFKREIGIQPIWICPTRAGTGEYPFCPLEKEGLYFDFGFWDAVPSQEAVGFYNRKIERAVQEVGGFKSLYSSSYFSENEFWQIYNRSAYKALKQKYDPSGRLKDLFVKCVAVASTPKANSR